MFLKRGDRQAGFIRLGTVINDSNAVQSFLSLLLLHTGFI